MNEFENEFCEGFCICAKAKATHYVQNLCWRNFKYFGVCDNCLRGYNEDIDHFRVLSEAETIVLQIMEEK